MSRIISLSSAFFAYYSRMCLLKTCIVMHLENQLQLCNTIWNISPPISTSLTLYCSLSAFAIILFVCKYVRAIKWALCLRFAPGHLFGLSTKFNLSFPIKGSKNKSIAAASKAATAQLGQINRRTSSSYFFSSQTPPVAQIRACRWPGEI